MAQQVGRSLLIVGFLLAGCGTNQVTIQEGPASDMERGEDFASVPQELVFTGTSKNDTGGIADNKNFYIAIRKSALSKRWFLASYP